MLHCQHRTQIQVGLGPPTDQGYVSICHHHPSKLLLSLLGRLSWDWPLRGKGDHWGVKMRNFTELREKIIMKEEEGKGDSESGNQAGSSETLFLVGRKRAGRDLRSHF